jgi:hypothetical protein
MVGPRIFDVEEVDALLPELERLVNGLDRHRRHLKQLTVRANALELIWGDKVHEDDNPDHPEFQAHIADLQKTKEALEACTEQIGELGGEVKGVEPVLVDFLGVRERRLIYWCWTKGEQRITHWHHVDEGFSARQPL